jgi:Fe-S-cluster containining protein
MTPTLEPPQRAELKALYQAVDEAVAQAGPSCALSGRCCRFAEFGHTLFLTAPEAALLLAEAPPPARPLDDGQRCPWQDQHGRCHARDARPLGCRVYFCDESYATRMTELMESALNRLKAWTRSRGLSWDYRPLHDHLRQAAREGYPFPPDLPPRDTRENMGMRDGLPSPPATSPTAAGASRRVLS